MVEILLLTEDSAEDAFNCQKKFVRYAARLVIEGAQTHKIQPKPSSHEESKFTMKANGWLSDKGPRRRGRTLLCKEIATMVAQGKFAVFHYDADATWKKKNKERQKKFDKRIKNVVQVLLEKMAQEKGKPIPIVNHHLFPMVPHWAIEAWTYQNTTKAAQLAAKHFDANEAKKFKHWELNRAELDEVDMTKKKASKLKDKHNLELVESGWPAEPVYEANASFTAFVDTLKSSPPFVKALEETRR